eukprot:COSAG06_NODE_1151_length_10496_cov_14.282004_11_plen_96_part_00
MVVADADAEGACANAVELRLADGKETGSVMVDTLTEASEAEIAEYEVEVARWADADTAVAVAGDAGGEGTAAIPLATGAQDPAFAASLQGFQRPR